MLGNDVVDLADPETLTRHAGFDARVFSPSERRAIENSGDPHAARQMLWAAKESAYKAARRQDPGVVFSPIRFAATLDADGAGQVRHEAGDCQVHVRRSGDCIHAVARVDGDPFLSRSGVTEIRGESASRAVRALALAEISDVLGLSPEFLRIERRDRIPELRLRGAPLPTLLTLSHHGRYAAYAALPCPTPREDPV